MTVIDCEQRSPQWYAARLGRLTASRASDMLSMLKGGSEAAGRRNLRAQLVLERLTGKSQDSGYQSEAMRIGIEREPDALLAYEAATGRLVQRTGFIQHDELMVGASLDGHVGDWEGVVECKCPIAATHLETLQSELVPNEYQKQMLHQIWLAGALWGDYVSWNPDFPERLQLKVLRIQMDVLAISVYIGKVRAFLAEVDRDTAALRTMADLPGVLAEAVA